jgi:hypothetical protein
MVPCLGYHLCSGTQCGNCIDSLEAFLCDVRQRKVLDIAIKEVSGALSMHAASPAKQIVCGTRRSDSPVRAS